MSVLIIQLINKKLGEIPVGSEGGTNEKTHGSDDSPSETDDCVRNLAN